MPDDSVDTDSQGLSHLGLVGIPFRVVPDLEFARIWADRAGLRSDVEALLRNFGRAGPSTLHPVWGWYGAGKTHVLYHMLGRCRDLARKIGAAYTEIGSSLTSFVDLYRQFALDFLNSQPLFSDVFAEVWSDGFRQRRQDFVRAVCPGLPDFQVAMNYLNSGLDVHKETVMKYLCASKVPLTELRTVGIGSRIETDDQALEAFASFVRLVSNSRRMVRVVWFVDELQNLTALSPRAKARVQLGLEQVFNKCPNNLSLIIAYSGRQQDRLSTLVSGAFVSRVGAQRRISIPVMEPPDTIDFVRDLLSAFRPAGQTPPNAFFPFEDQTVPAVVAFMVDQEWYLKPRSVMECFRAILEEAEPLLARREIRDIEPNFALSVLRSLAADNGVVQSLKRID